MGYGSRHRHFFARTVVAGDVAKEPFECLVSGLFKVSFHDGFGKDVGRIIADLELVVFFQHFVRSLFDRHGIHRSNDYDRCCKYDSD
ncbi:MAG: hypothetical protein MZV64_31270 [Ignavibacteriales bacterium]|nr:hypothetical protein [Ignavibacteriales bacterium]